MSKEYIPIEVRVTQDEIRKYFPDLNETFESLDALRERINPKETEKKEPKKKDDWVSFYTDEDITGGMELQYSKRRNAFKEIKQFYDDSYGSNIRICEEYDLSEEEQKAFDAAFPELVEKD